MKILLTGASGFIGRNLVSLNPRFFRQVHRTGYLDSDSNFFYIDSLDKDTNWEGCFESIDAVIHLAGIAHNYEAPNEIIYAVNYQGAINLAVSAAKNSVKRFVYVSTASLSCANHAKNLNYQSKLKMKVEKELLEIGRTTGMEIVIVRPALVYGAEAPGNINLLLKAIKLLPCLPFGLVKNSRDFISVHNLCDLLVVCAKHPLAGGHVFTATDLSPISTRKFTMLLSKSLGIQRYQLPVPVWLLKVLFRVIGKSRQSELLIGDFVVDSSKLLEVLNWTPPYTIEESMFLNK
ncbi:MULTISPECIES: NAD-dependent epimerase/dehydratase family protein [unclassified Shewanella]|uniref:NAD-dependent epimerase/dehydratase family protein n=1 Tax=unclassified Shewanella TaxID=196818 RepID=UPI0039B58241